MKEVDIEKFIEITNSSLTMAQAASKLNMHFNTFKKLAIKFDCYKPNQGGKGTHKKPIVSYSLADILNNKYPHYQAYKLKNRLIKEGYKENKCEICGISNWNDKELKMELHHKDGNKYNNSLENLIILCPNCHSQTDTFRAKNIKNKK